MSDTQPVEQTDQGSDDERLLAAILALDGRRGWLFTVLATWGSAPRPPGSLLLLDANGGETGSVSGGCVEADLASRMRAGEFSDSQLPRKLSYGVDAEDARRFGIPCGGRLDLLVEAISDPTPWRIIQRRVLDRGLMRRSVCLATGEASLHLPAEHEPAPATFHCDEQRVARTFGPALRLLIIGAVHITQHLVPIARALGYRVVVCDPRPERLGELSGLGAELDRRMPDDSVRALANDPSCAVVALTHDPRLDDMALMEALDSAAFYVGALGSRRTQQARRERLAQLGLDASRIERLHGPVGLPLGGRLPAEIAVSIAAELIAARNTPPTAG
jgi:xanthine dehydrogenase accessory factor